MNENITISEEVVETIANIATKEVKGVAGLHTGVVDTNLDKVRTNWSGGVSAVITEESVLITIVLNIFYGEKINEVAKKVQENVKHAVETMTERTVSEVNIHVHGVVVATDKSDK